MSDKPNKMEQIRDYIKKPYDEMLSDMKKSGKMQHQMGELAWAKEIIFEIERFASNESLSIDDRVEKMRMMVELIKSMPRAKPNNYLWDELYDAGYIPEMQFWDIWKSMRQFYGTYTVVEIEEYVAKKVKEKDVKGTEREVDKSGWNARTVDPSTALELWMHQPEAQIDSRGQESPVAGNVHILRTIKTKSANAEADLPYTEDWIEKQIASFGRGEAIPAIRVVINHLFNEFNVTPQAILILNTMMQGQQGQTTLHVTAQTEESQNI